MIGCKFCDRKSSFIVYIEEEEDSHFVASVVNNMRRFNYCPMCGKRLEKEKEAH